MKIDETGRILIESQADFVVADFALQAAGVPELAAGLTSTRLRIDQGLDKYPYLTNNFADQQIRKGLGRIASNPNGDPDHIKVAHYFIALIDNPTN